MQYVNDDMDELFRRAAENYPLDTNSADWNKVLAAMQGQDASTTVPEKKGNRNRHFLWLLLLLPLGFICNKLYSPGSTNDLTISNPVATEQNRPADKRADQKPDEQLFRGNAEVSVNEQENITIQKKSTDVSGSIEPLQKTVYNSSFASSKTNANRQEAYNAEVFSAGQNREKPGVNTIDLNETAPRRNYVSWISLKRTRQELPAINLDKDIAPLKNPFEESSKSKAPVGRRQNRFYAGLVGGIDATTVKFQKIENRGHDYGVLVGYELNKKWSIETGAYVANKYYYTDGKYLNTSKIYMPPNSRISEASGDCKMIEVPLSVRYNFSSAKKSTWFSTLGATSYFMKQEDYTYQYYYGTAGPVAHEKEYKNSTQNIFSNLSMSGGYMHKLGKTVDLRIEPYLKIPISGMGIADLPLFSAGVHIGVTKKF